MTERRRRGAASTQTALAQWALVMLSLTACASGEAPAVRSEGARLASLALPLAPAADAGEPGADAGGASDAAAGQSDDSGPSNGCCSPSSSGGCNDALVAACVCEGDPFCCSTEYDALCVNQAISRCGQDCDDRPPASDCCSASSVPGCTDAPVAACICEIDPFCCVFRFDQSCVNLGVSRCNATCSNEETLQ